MRGLAWVLGVSLAAGACGDDGETSSSAGSTGTAQTTSSTGVDPSTTFDTCVDVTACTASGISGSGSSDGGTASSTGGGESGSGSDTGMAATVPTPCMDVLDNWVETEPNDTPEQATDGCTTPDFPYWGNFPLGANLGGGDEVDYVVFQTPAAAGNIDLPVTPCWDGALDLLDWWIYEVTDTQVGAILFSSTTADLACEGTGTVSLAPSSVFLLELRQVDTAADPVNYFW